MPDHHLGAAAFYELQGPLRAVRRDASRCSARFRTPQQQTAALKGFADGSVDVLVGTHRLLSRDVNPHDLGLGDHRRGAALRRGPQGADEEPSRESIDVLTLSATPIPRTMQMSLSGVRDMSLILTPPDDRRPVEVHVGEWDPDVVSAAIRRELARGGQVYYVLQPRPVHRGSGATRTGRGRARRAWAWRTGRWTRSSLEQRDGGAFSAGQLDVLVATTIIESGIDNPHTNTLIIEDSQRLGLAQMYQLKGRVGRGVHPGVRVLHVPRTREPHRGGAGAPDGAGRAHGLGQRHAHRHARP